MKKGDIIELNIEKYAFEGKGIAKINKNIISPSGNPDEKSYVVFVNNSYPGDVVKARLLKIKKSYAEAKTVEIIKPSVYRVKAKCKYFGTCGGCKQQDLDYDIQLKYKQEQVKEIFTKMGGLKNLSADKEGFEMLEIIPSEKIFYYRNKMEFSFSDKRWLTENELEKDEITNKNFALGLHIPRIYDKVLDIDECFLQSDISNKIINFSREFFKKKKADIYSTKTHQGYLRNLVIKKAHKTDDFPAGHPGLMINLVTSNEDDELLKEYTEKIIREIPQISTIINNINLKKANIAVGDYEKVYYGSGFIYDYIGKYKFRISANSFFQTNTLQAENLYKTAMDFAELKGSELVYDLYSGAGTIAIFISGKVKEVFAFESVESAIKDAEDNKRINEVNNVHFFTADLYKSFLPAVEEKKLPKPDVIIIDPPRSGMHKNTIADVLELNPEKIVYVSCNPATQVRDIKMMIEGGYKLVKIKPVDMFPHTYHIENIALLVK